MCSWWWGFRKGTDLTSVTAWMLLTSHSELLCCCYPPKMSIINLEAWLSSLVCFHTSVSAGQLSLAVAVLSWKDNYNRWYFVPSLFSHHWWESEQWWVLVYPTMLPCFWNIWLPAAESEASPFGLYCQYVLGPGTNSCVHSGIYC